MNSHAQVPLGKVCTINPRAMRTRDFGGMLVSFVPMAAVDERLGAITVCEDRPIAEISKGYTPFEDGDVLFAKITPCMENGKAALARNLTNGIGRGSTEFHVLRPGKEVIGEYVHYVVRQDRFRDEAKRSFTGTGGQKRVPRSFMENVLIPLPPLDEQQRIVGILNRADKIEQLQARAQMRLLELIPALFVRMFGDTVENTMGWPLGTLKDLCHVDRQGCRPDDPSATKLSFVGVEHVEAESGMININNDSLVGGQRSMSFLFDERHILYGKLRPYLNKVAIPEFSGRCSTELIPILPRKGVHREFIASLLRQKTTVDYAMASITGSRMPRTDMNELMLMPVPLPPVEHQRRYARIVRTAYSAVALASSSQLATRELNATLMSSLLRLRDDVNS